MRDQAYDEDRLLNDDITACYAFSKRGDWLFMVHEMKSFFFECDTLLDPNAEKLMLCPLLYMYYCFLTRAGAHTCLSGGFQ
jgi:hypothetical protein